MKPDEYKVFLPGTRFFSVSDNVAALDPRQAQSLVAVGPTIHKFLIANKLVESPVDYAKGVDSSVLADALKK
jgi:NitT/TauT family transport system substrate-binding protein